MATLTAVPVEEYLIRRPAGSVLTTPLVGDVDFAELFRQLDEPAE